MIKDDGGKVRKRNSREIAIKRSLTQIKKKWPKCCPSSTASNKNLFGFSHPSLASIVKKPSQSSSQNNIDEGVARLTEKIENLFNVLNEKVARLEDRLSELSHQIDLQNSQNCVTHDEWNELKSKFEKSIPTPDQVQSLSEPQNVLFLSNLRHMNASNCEIKVNIRDKTAPSQDSSSGDTTVCASDDDEDVVEEENAATGEIKWLKERMLELSDSVKMQSQVVKRLKNESFTKLKDEVNEVSEVLDDIKGKIIENKQAINSIKFRDFASLRNDVDAFETKTHKLHSQLQELKNKMEKIKDDVDKRMSLLRTEVESRLMERSRSVSPLNASSEVINTQILQQSDEHVSKQFDQEMQGLKCCSTPSCCSTRKHRQSFPPHHNFVESSVDLSLKGDNFIDLSAPILATNCCPVQSTRNNYQNPIFQTISTDQMCGQFVPQCPETPEYDCMQTDLVDNLMDIQKQVSSHSFCLKQLIHDIAMKLDRCEFERCRRQLSETIDLVMKLKKDPSSPLTAAGCTIPLMQNVNCLSCQTTTNMRIMENQPVPKAPPLKFGRSGSEMTNSNIRSQCQSMSNRNWTCYNRTNGRRAGGSHTKISKSMQVSELRYKRLKTPVKIVSSIMVYRNRFRRARDCC